MRVNAISTAMLILGLAACKPAAEQQQPVIANKAEPAPTPPPATPPAENVTLPDDRTPLIEPKGPIDPKSSEAAGQVVQHYGALIEQKRFAEAEKLWGSADAAASFTAQLKRYSEAHMEIGKPGESEGAAGSIYVTVPAIFYGPGFRRAADVVLRRVNDVPGSTEAQRRWHIENINWTVPKRSRA